MKILVVGEFRWEIYESALYDAFNQLGYDTYKFEWGSYLDNSSNYLKSIYNKFQNKFTIGPAIKRINNDLIKYCKTINPNLVFIYRGTHILPSTIKKISEQGIIIFGYNNDDPFSKVYPNYYWRHYIRGIKYYSHIFAYRKKNIDDYKKVGYSQVTLLRSYYIKSRNHHIDELINKNYKTDVIFIGHFEDDGRDIYLKSLVNAGIKIKIYGDRESWQRSENFSVLDKICGPIVQIRNDYNLALNSAKIALVFLSKINNDSYTRRCFEIPATKTLMVSEYTDDLNSLFQEKKEAIYFRNESEFLENIKYYLINKNQRKEIGVAGYKRLVSEGHEVQDRVNEIINIYRYYNQKECE